MLQSPLLKEISSRDFRVLKPMGQIMEKEMCQAHDFVRSSQSNKDWIENYNRDQRKVVINKGFKKLGITWMEIPQEISRNREDTLIVYYNRS
jgi:hypothetical protein